MWRNGVRVSRQAVWKPVALGDSCAVPGDIDEA